LQGLSISVTTDGFLTNALESEVDITGVLSQRFKSYCGLIDPGGPMLAVKHQVRQAVSFKTRGIATLLPYDGSPEILAKSSVSLDCRNTIF